MDLSIIIVNWNVKDLLRKCLASIYEHTKDICFEVIVVDNNSHDGSAEMVMKEFPQVKIIANNFNAGFSAANNQGLEIAQGEFVLFMNPDMELVENSPAKMINFMHAHPQAGISTCMLKYPDGSRQNNLKRDPTLLSQIPILLKIHHFIRSKAIKKYLGKDIDYSKEQEVEQIMGAFTFARRDMMLKLNGWSKDFYIWWEDVDLCKRARQAGWKIMYTTSTYVIHHEGKSFAQQMSLEKQKRFTKGMLIYFKKHKKAAMLILLILVPASLLLAWLVQLARIRPRPQGKL